MTIRSRWRVALLGSVGILSLGALPLLAQEPRADKPAAAPEAAAKRAPDPARRVPSFFGQIGLSPEQREAIYKVRAKHLPKIGELEKQVAQIRLEMMTECEAVLTDTQKQLLEQRRRATSERRKAQAPPTTAAPAASQASEEEAR
jgi:hypothetical protein